MDRFVSLCEDMEPGTSFLDSCLKMKLNGLVIPALRLELTSIPQSLIFTLNCGNVTGVIQLLQFQMWNVFSRKKAHIILQRISLLQDVLDESVVDLLR